MVSVLPKIRRGQRGGQLHFTLIHNEMQGTMPQTANKASRNGNSTKGLPFKFARTDDKKKRR